MVAKESRDDYYAELGKLFLVSNTQIGMIRKVAGINPA
jgi:hypothetical protein